MYTFVYPRHKKMLCQSLFFFYMNGTISTLYSYIVVFKKVGSDKQWAGCRVGVEGAKEFHFELAKAVLIQMINFRKLENFRAKRNLSAFFFFLIRPFPLTTYTYTNIQNKTNTKLKMLFIENYLPYAWNLDDF